jgi:hypothetical protein
MTAGSATTFGGRGDHLFGSYGDYQINGDSGADTISGGPGLDQIDGGAGNDKIDGSTGNDTILGGSGHDRLKDGVGDDQFVFRFANDGGDTIVDFASGGDHMALAFGLAASDFRFIGFAGGDDPIGAGATLSYTKATGELFFDPTGNDPADHILIATLSSRPRSIAATFCSFRRRSQTSSFVTATRMRPGFAAASPPKTRGMARRKAQSFGSHPWKDARAPCGAPSTAIMRTPGPAFALGRRAQLGP